MCLHRYQQERSQWSGITTFIASIQIPIDHCGLQGVDFNVVTMTVKNVPRLMPFLTLIDVCWRVIFLRYSFWTLFLNIAIYDVKGDNLLLLGDSIDRHACDEWCITKSRTGSVTNSSVWGPWVLAAHHMIQGRMGTYYCKTHTDSVAYAQIYGSNAVGPYRKYGIDPRDIFDHTTARLNLSISSYISSYGLPDRIMFQTVQWDVAHLVNSVRKFNITEVAIKFKSNILARVDEIMHLVGDSVDVGLRTGPRSLYHFDLVHVLNEVIREIAMERNLTLYDYDLDVWSSVDFDFKMETHLFRDWIHPRYPYTAVAADKMLGRQFSNAMTIRKGKKSSLYYSSRFEASPLNSTIVYLWQDATTNETFFFNRASGSRHSAPNKDLLRALRLGPYDVHRFTGTALYTNTRLGEAAPTYFIEGTIFNVTLNETAGTQLYRYGRSVIRLLPVRDMIIGLGRTDADIVLIDTKSADSLWMTLVEIGRPVSKIYSQQSEWLIREDKKRDVYWVRNGTRTRAHSAAEMAARNKTFDDVVVVSEEEGVDLLPEFFF